MKRRAWQIERRFGLPTLKKDQPAALHRRQARTAKRRADFIARRSAT